MRSKIVRHRHKYPHAMRLRLGGKEYQIAGPQLLLRYKNPL